MPLPDTRETDNTFLIGRTWDGLYRDRYSFQRDTLLEEAVRAWRLNPLARRLTNLFKIYNVDDVGFKCEDTATSNFLQSFWDHELNQMDDMLEEISNELFLTGNLFTCYTVDDSGMTYVRVFPTDQIAEIQTAPNDLRQEQAYVTKPIVMEATPQTFLNLPTTPVFMKHKAVNRLAGTVWGEGEIWPDLPWLGRYASFLENRARLNQYRTAFMYVVSGAYANEAERKARERDLQANPPKPGSLLVLNSNNGEEWGILSATLDAFDSSVDGLAIKKMIAVNHVPMHYLAEPESSTRTTADAAGTPTFKAFEFEQTTFKKIIHGILKIAVQRRNEKDNKVSPSAKIEITAGDATERDNVSLAMATTQIVEAIGNMYDRKLLDEGEYLRLVYRFMGETLSADWKPPKGIRKTVNPVKPASQSTGGGKSEDAIKAKTDAESGDVNVKVPGE